MISKAQSNGWREERKNGTNMSKGDCRQEAPGQPPKGWFKADSFHLPNRPDKWEFNEPTKLSGKSKQRRADYVKMDLKKLNIERIFCDKEYGETYYLKMSRRVEALAYKIVGSPDSGLCGCSSY